MTSFNSPFLLGFDQLEQMLESAARSSADSYPPYNIEQMGDHKLRISLAVAGFEDDDLMLTIEMNQLIIKGRQKKPEESQNFIHRGIASRQFIRKFVLADGMEVKDAFLEYGLLHIDLVRKQSEEIVLTIPIRA
ncbi:Hsp20 family protein [Temperatibacter marinus]|uniref:Hsp20 family protein n=1 Tax=Temperatibacter marinus TaxID=1456591 RepID=A0AA52EES7_9PROT|nr:Hsp20 family protein [Temperatibacter marinus]WND03390.1 Hsp20 family protein [Temperatibacter marinus]